MSEKDQKKVVVIGAGPAGLTAAYELTRHSLSPIVLEQSSQVGGLSRTENYKGYYFDMGGHRFFTKVKEVDQLWREILGDDFLRRPRMSRIYYQNKFFYYPLKQMNVLVSLGIVQSIAVVLSFLKWQIFPYKQEDTFEQWVTNRFGKRLFEIFFKTYTEKVWGISCSELKAEWAAQRIKDLSFKTALQSMLIKPKKTIKSLIEEFDYPSRGPGMLWNRMRDEIELRNGVVCVNSPVVRIQCSGNRIDHVVISNNGSGEQIIPGTDFISSMPVTDLINRMDPVPPDVLHAAKQLKYRDFLTVCLIVNQPNLFEDNWIYVHSPEVKVGRIQNFKNWSPDMVPDHSKTSLGLEYFCTEGDEIWSMADSDLIVLGKQELERIGLARGADVEDGCVFRVPKSYPIYDTDYQESLQTIRKFVDGLENLQAIGRNGLHRYNNQDHSMVTAMLAVRNLLNGEKHDLWSVNTDQEFHEEISAQEQADDLNEKITETFTHIFPRLAPIPFALASGLTASLVILFATLFLVAKGGPVVGPHLLLLEQLFPGYSVSIPGSMIGLVYLFFTGFILGLVSAYLRNLFVYISAVFIHREIELRFLRKLLDVI